MKQKFFLSFILFLSLFSCKNSIDTKYTNEIQNQDTKKIEKPTIQVQKIEDSNDIINQYREKIKEDQKSLEDKQKEYMESHFKAKEIPPIGIYNVNKELVLEKNGLFKVRFRAISVCLYNQINDIKLYSSNPDVVSVDNFGNIKALSIGTSEITISNKYQKTSLKVTVVENKNNSELIKINKGIDITSNFAFETSYKYYQTDVNLLNIYDHESKKIFSHPNTHFLEWGDNKEKVFVKIDTNIYSMNINGSEKKKLNEIDLSQYPIMGISKDGKKAVFNSVYCSYNGNLFVHTFGVDKILPLILLDYYDQVTFNTDSISTWSPNGNKIIFSGSKFPNTSTLKHLNSVNSSWNLFLVDIDNLTIDALTDDDGFETNFTWSPDGNKVLSESNFYDSKTTQFTSKIRVINLENKTMNIVFTKDQVSGCNPKWSPEGNKIIFTLRENGQSNLYVVDEDGSNIKELTQGIDISNYIWMPNEDNILFLSDKNKIYQVNSESLNQKLVLELLEEDNKILGIY